MKRLLIIGCGDIARRSLPALQARWHVSALVRSAADASVLAAAGVEAMTGDLDRPESLEVLRAGADLVLHSAPPQASGETDLRTRSLLDSLERAMVPRRLVYLSTSGVYGDCDGALVDETSAPAPATDRARRRLDAETQLARWSAERSASLAILRVPGIYAADRLPLDRLRAGMPALRAEDDVFTNHIHADDLAAIVTLALERTDAEGVFNASDDSAVRMGDWFDLVADRHGLERPHRISRERARAELPAMLLSFMSESRRLKNDRMKQVLGARLRYPTVFEGVPGAVLAA
jgi:nucleoside-diphosphate-sugar epimerase